MAELWKVAAEPDALRLKGGKHLNRATGERVGQTHIKKTRNKGRDPGRRAYKRKEQRDLAESPTSPPRLKGF